MEEFSPSVKSTTVSCMDKILVESDITCFERSGVTLKNQVHRFQLVIKNLQVYALYNVRIEVTGDLAPFVTFGVIDGVPAEYTFIGKTDDYYLGKSGVYPDVIRPLKTGDIILTPNGNKCFLVCVESCDGLPVGIHNIGFKIFDAENKLMGETEYKLRVLDAEIKRADIRKSNWMHYDCICNAHGVDPFSKEFYRVFGRYLAAYIRSGFNMLLTPLFTPPLDTFVGGERKTTQLIGVFYENGKYSFDFTELKEFLDFVLSCGIKYIEFSHLFTQWGGERCPKIIAEISGEKKKIFGWENDSTGEEYKTFLNAFLPELVKFINAEKIADKCCFHITDEPNEKHLERYKELREIVKRNVGDIPTIDALSNYDYYKQGLVDIPISEVSHIGEFIENNAENLMAYYCCEPSDRYYSNRFLNMPLQRTRILGIQLYLSDVKGFLHWGFNFYNSGLSYYSVNPYANTNAGGAFPPGDGFIVYPNGDGVNLSMRSEIMAEGFEDYDLLYTLEQKIGRAKVVELLKREGLNGFTDYPKDLVWHTDFVANIKELIAENNVKQV